MWAFYRTACRIKFTVMRVDSTIMRVESTRDTPTETTRTFLLCITNTQWIKISLITDKNLNFLHFMQRLKDTFIHLTVSSQIKF
jgi:hypothetical protein